MTDSNGGSLHRSRGGGGDESEGGGNVSSGQMAAVARGRGLSGGNGVDTPGNGANGTVRRALLRLCKLVEGGWFVLALSLLKAGWFVFALSLLKVL